MTGGGYPVLIIKNIIRVYTKNIHLLSDKLNEIELIMSSNQFNAEIFFSVHGFPQPNWDCIKK